MSDSEAIAEVARRIAADTGGFTGGDVGLFEEVGRHTLLSLQQNGLAPHHRLLDLGCGTLRLGYFLVRYLDPERYFGIEPTGHYLAAGLKHAIGMELRALKRPRFDRNRNFDFSVFGVAFDYVVARSIFSHASPAMIARVMDAFRGNTSDNAIMLASWRPTLPKHRGLDVVETEESGDDWKFRRYRFEYLEAMARERGLVADRFGEAFNGQVWLRLARR
ncbi:MAG TPA: class I SAM-dependent methyltransferase [Rhizomicrobium sp.]|nr:class I SAM-dependent methyltransferase [Rhizomicrobium sp.]